MRRIVTVRPFFRPWRSAKEPRTSPPMGLMRYETPKTANVWMSWTPGSSPGKKFLPM
jgi:hypothetical protein